MKTLPQEKEKQVIKRILCVCSTGGPQLLQRSITFSSWIISNSIILSNKFKQRSHCVIYMSNMIIKSQGELQNNNNNNNHGGARKRLVNRFSHEKIQLQLKTNLKDSGRAHHNAQQHQRRDSTMKQKKDHAVIRAQMVKFADQVEAAPAGNEREEYEQKAASQRTKQSVKVLRQQAVGPENQGYQSHRRSERTGKNNVGIVISAGRKSQVNQLQLKYHSQQDRVGVVVSATERVVAAHATDREAAPQQLYSGCKIPGRQQQPQSASQRPPNSGSDARLAQNVQLKFQKQKNFVDVKGDRGPRKHHEQSKTQRDQPLSQNIQLQREEGQLRKEKSKGVHTHRNVINDDQYNLKASGTGPLKNEWSDQQMDLRLKQPLQEVEGKGREVVPMQLRTQLKRNLLQSSNNIANTKASGAGEVALPAAQQMNNVAHLVSPARPRQEPVTNGQNQYANDYQPTARQLGSSVSSGRIQSRLSSSQKQQEVIAVKEELQRVASNVANIYNIRSGSSREEELREGPSANDSSSPHQNARTPMRRGQYLESRQDKSQSQPVAHKKTPSAGQVHLLSSALADKKRPGNGVMTQAPVGQINQASQKEVSRFNGGHEEARNHQSKEQNSSRTRMAALALNSKLQNKSRIKTEPREQLDHAKKDRSARQEGTRRHNIELGQPLLDSGRQPAKIGGKDAALRASTSRVKVVKDSQIKIIPVLRDLDVAKSKQAELQALSSAERSQEPYQVEVQGAGGLLMQVSARGHADERQQPDESVAQRIQRGASSSKKQKILPKPKQKLNLLHNESQKAGKSQQPAHPRIDQRWSEAAMGIGVDAEMAADHAVRDWSADGWQARDVEERSRQVLYHQYPPGKSSTQPMVLKVDSGLAGQSQAPSAIEGHQVQQQQSVERRRLIFQRQKVFNLSSRDELGAQSHTGLRQHQDGAEQASKFNHNPLMKSRSKETSVSSVEHITSVNTKKNSRINMHQKAQVLSSSLLHPRQNTSSSRIENSKACNVSHNLYGPAIDQYSSKEDSQLQQHQQPGGRLEASKQDMNSTIHEIIRKQQEQISKKNLNVKRMPVPKVEIAKAKQGLTEVVVKNSKISCGGGVVQQYPAGSPMRRPAPLTSMRNVNLKAPRIENESNMQRAIDSRRMIEQRGPFPSSQMKPHHDRHQNQAEQLNLHGINAPTKQKKRQSHNAGDQREGPGLTNGRAGSEDSHLNDLIVSIKKQQQKRSIKLQSQINDAAPATVMAKPSLTNARRYDTQAAIGPSGILILNSGSHNDSQQIPKSYKSAAFQGKATSQREHPDELTTGKRSSTKLQNQELTRLNKLQSHQNLNCISSLQADQAAQAPPARAASNFNHGAHEEARSIRSLQSVKHYGLQNIPQASSNLVNAQNAGSTNSDHRLNAPSILKAQQPINRFRSQPGSKFLLHEESQQQVNPQPKSQLQAPNGQNECATSTGKYQNIQVQLSNQYLKLRSFQQHESEDMRLLKDGDLAAQHRTSYGFNAHVLPAKQQAAKQAEYPPEEPGAGSRAGNSSANPAKSVQMRTARHLPHIQTHGTNIEMRRLQLSNLNQQSSRAEGHGGQRSDRQLQHSERQKQSRSQRSIEQIDTHRLIQEHYSNERQAKEGCGQRVRLKDQTAKRAGTKRDQKQVQSHEVLRIKKDLVKSHRQPAVGKPTSGNEGELQAPPGQGDAHQASQPPTYTAIQEVQQLQTNSKRNGSHESGNSGRSALAFISSRNPANLRYGGRSGIKTERHLAREHHEHDNTNDTNRIGDEGHPPEPTGTGSHLASKKTGRRRGAVQSKEDRYAAMERLLIDEKDRILETNENNSHLSSHKQIMKSDDSVRFIKQKAEVNIKKQLQPKQSDRVNGLEKSRSSRNLSHSHGTYRLKEQASPDGRGRAPRNQPPEQREEPDQHVDDAERKHQATSFSSIKKNSSQKKVNSKFLSLSSSRSPQNTMQKRQLFVSSKNIQINNFNLNQELKSDLKQPRKVQEKQALRKQSPEKHDKEPRTEVEEALKPNRQQISEIPINNSASQQEMLNFIDYLDDRFHLLSETSKPHSVVRGAASKLEDSVAEVQKIESSTSRRKLKQGLPQRPQQQQPIKTERFKGLKLKTELQTSPNMNNVGSQKSLTELDLAGQVSPVKAAPSQADIEGRFEQQTELEFLCGLDNSIKFIDQQNSLTPSQQQALALFEQESQSEALQACQRRSEGQKAHDQPTQSDNQSLSSVQMLVKLQQRGKKVEHSANKSQKLSAQKRVVLSRNPSELVEAEQQQDISPLKISGEAPEDDADNWHLGEVDSPWRQGGSPPRSKTETLSKGREEERQQKQDDMPSMVRPFDPDASFYSFQ